MARKSKSIEEAVRAMDTCPVFFDETLRVAVELAAVKEKNIHLMKQIMALYGNIRSKDKEILSLHRTIDQYEAELASGYHYCSVHSKRARVELQLGTAHERPQGGH